MSKTMDILVMTNHFFPMCEADIEQIKKINPGIHMTVINHKEVTLEMLQKAEIIFGWPPIEQLPKALKLKWLHLPSAGADYYTIRENYYNQEIQVTNSSGVFGLPIAEHVFAMILSYNRNLQEYAYHKLEKKWNGIRNVRDFYGSTIGVIGLGDIGMEVAKRAKAWGARVLAVKRTLEKKPEYVDQLYTTEEIDVVLEQSDYIVLALPNTPRTVGMITEERLKKMKSHSFIVNIGRGSVIDQDALIKALKENWIGGAGLDVTTPEPLPEESLLWELPNVIITPHASGNSPTNQSRRLDIIINNLKRYIDNLPLENLVSFEECY